MATFGRFKNAWNAFLGRDPTELYIDHGQSSGINPSRPRFIRAGNSKSNLKTFYCRIANDCASIDIKHVRLDDNDRYVETINDELNRVLTKDANIDQTGRELIRDTVISMLDEGVVAVVPFETDDDPLNGEAFKVLKARTAKILEWYPHHIKVNIYNEDTGQYVQMILEKRICAIIENPFFTIMNEPNITSQRLSRVNSQLDSTNEQASSGKIDMLIQLPFPIKSAARRIQAKRRQKELEDQLNGSVYGIGYIDATEKVIQLNRSLDNNLWEQSQGLQEQLFSELGFSQAILDGTASEQQMLNYQNNIIEPILTTIVEAMERKWLSKTARTQGQAIRFFKQPFKLVPVNQIADIADKFTRNEIMTSNEMRGVIGMEPIDDPKANELRNANLNHPDEEGTTSTVVDEVIKHSELYHHGIPGQKWGVRNGPPYPLISKVDPRIIKKKNTYQIQNEEGNVVSELKYYDYKMKDFDWILLADVETKSRYRGKGLATDLLNSMYTDVIEKKNPNKGIYLFVKDDNTNAINLYKKLGFDTTKTYHLEGSNEGNYLIMTKGNADIKQFDKMNFS